MNSAPQADFANLLISATVVLVFVIGIWYLVRKANKNNLTVGQHLNRIFMREESTILIMLIAGMNIMEALVAASIHPQGGSQVNAVARFAMHLMFGFAGAFCAINAPKKIMEFFKDMKYFFKEIDPKDKTKVKPAKPIIPIVDLLLGIGLLVISIGLPYANVMIMANGLGESEVFRQAMWQLLPWVSNAQLGIADSNYSAMDHMTMVMMASYVALITHILISLIDGLYAVYERYKYGLDRMDEERTKKGYGLAENNGKEEGKKEDNKENNKDNNGKKKNDEEDTVIAQHLKYLLNFLNITDADTRNGYYKKMLQTFSANVGPTSATISSALYSWYEKVKNYNEVTAKDPANDSATLKRLKEELATDLRDYFQSPPSSGGFGLTIAKN